jgi:hypothetical protein
MWRAHCSTVNTVIGAARMTETTSMAEAGRRSLLAVPGTQGYAGLMAAPPPVVAAYLAPLAVAVALAALRP